MCIRDRDNLGADLERLHQLNRLASVVPADELARRGIRLGLSLIHISEPTRPY